MENKFMPQQGYFALEKSGKLEGFLEDHLAGHLPEEVFGKDQYLGWWKLNTGDRAGCMHTLIEAHRLGLLPEERQYYLQAWNVQDKDCYEFARKARITLLISGGGYRASYIGKQEIVHFAMGATPFLALCNLWIVLKTPNHAQEAKK